jgi:deazaflavin-dependent oxidoreductase (nitroreductase family)
MKSGNPKKDRWHQKPPPVWRLMRRLNPHAAANFRRGIGPGGMVLLLTTTGRKSGLPRLTPLQYELVEGVYVVASARGPQADWFRNLQANPQVEVEVSGQRFNSQAEAITDPARIADFLQLRLERHPLAMGILMRLEGLPLKYSRQDLEKFASHKALAAIRPEQSNYKEEQCTQSEPF